MEIVEIGIDELVPYANNAKLHPAKQVERIAESIRRYGFNDPVGVWENGDGELEIVEGHGRVLAARLLGIGKVPCIRLDGLDDEQRRAYTLIHNKITMNTGFDVRLLMEELASLPDMGAFGFDTDYSFPDTGETEGDGLITCPRCGHRQEG